MAAGAERGEIVDAVQTPLSARRILSMVNFQIRRGSAQATAPPVTLQGLLPQPSPLRRCEVLLVAHAGHAGSHRPTVGHRMHTTLSGPAPLGQSCIKHAVNAVNTAS
jgi:hypothetical protein